MVSGLTLVAQVLKVTIREARKKKRPAIRANKPAPADGTLERVELMHRNTTDKPMAAYAISI